MDEQQVKENLIELIGESLHKFNWEYFKRIYHVHENFSLNVQKILKDSHAGSLNAFRQLLDNRDAIVVNDSSKDLLKALSELKKMADSYDASAVQENLQRLIRIVLVQSNAIVLELFHPLQQVVQFAENKEVSIRDLSTVPLYLMYQTSRMMKSAVGTDKTVNAYLRRILTVAMNGGIPRHLIDKVKDLKIASSEFDEALIPLKRAFTVEADVMKSIEDFFNNYKHHEHPKYRSEAMLRSFVMDYLLLALITKNSTVTLPCFPVPELHIENFYNISGMKRVDYVVLDKRFDIPIAFVEIGLEQMIGNVGHKDSCKTFSMMSIGCFELADQLQKAGADPRDARIFGILIGGTWVQLVVAYPTIEEIDGGKSQIHINISCSEHWGFDLVGPSNNLSGSCSCCHADGFEINLKPSSNPLTSSSIDADVVAKTKKIKLTDEMLDESEEQYSESETTRETVSIGELNKDSVGKLAIFIECMKGYCTKLNNITRQSDPNRFKPILLPMTKFVPSSTSGSAGQTPNKSKVIGLKLESKEPSALSGQEHTISKPSGFEFELYKSIFRGAAVFPIMFNYKVNENMPSDTNSDKEKISEQMENLPKQSKEGSSSASVTYTFEKMSPILSDKLYAGMLGGHDNYFGPQIRDSTIPNLLVDASTVALHVLHGLYVLHEEYGVVHCDISPGNIMYSAICDRFKLNDFGASLPIDIASTVPRSNIGTKFFIAPESKETGFFTKASDIYSLGQVLLLNFNLRICFLLEMYLDDNEYDYLDPEGQMALKQEFEDISEKCEEFEMMASQLAAEDPSQRPSVLNAMAMFYKFLVKNQFCEIYGSRSVIPLIESILNIDINEQIYN